MFDRFMHRFRGLVNGESQSALLANPKKYRILLFAGMAFILLWQGLFFVNYDKIPTSPEYIRQGTSGFSHSKAKHFLYFFHQKGIFPLASRMDSAFTAADHTPAGADKIIAEHGETLVNEWEHWSRLGESARIFCFLPGAYIYGTAKPTIRPFNAMVLLFVLMFTWYMFWHYKRPWLGMFIILLAGSSPYVLAEIYRRENIFGVMAMHGLFQLALHLPLFKGKFKWKYLIIPAVAGIAIATAVNIRGEMLPIIASCFVIYLVNKEIKWLQRIALVAVLLVSYVGVKKGWESYFESKWTNALEVVTENGGNPYTGSRTGGHMFWHPVYCGLGDYDTEKGYKWHDTVPYTYAIPVLKEKYGIDLAYSGKYYIDEYYDDEEWYYKKFDEIPEYEEVVKEKVLADIKSDFGWYAMIVIKRIGGFFNNTSPVHLNFANFRIWIPWIGWLVLPILFLLWRIKAGFELKLLLFTLPMAASSIIIYGGGNSTYNSIFHLIGLALLFSWLFEDYLRWKKQRKEAVAVVDARKEEE